MNTIAMGVGGAFLLAVSAATGETFTVPREAVTWGAQSYLVLAGSIGVFWLYVFVLRGWTASAASYQLVLIPLVTVPVSAWLQNEPITWSLLVGSLLVLTGVYIGALWASRAARARAAQQVGAPEAPVALPAPDTHPR